MTARLEQIKHKLDRLKTLDSGFSIFGAMSHEYKLNPPLSGAAVLQFEEKHAIKLPEDYVHFLTELGNGGAGPFYGLELLEDTLFSDLDRKNPDFLINPSKPFLHTQAWNLPFPLTEKDFEDNQEEYDKQLFEFEKIYFDDAEINGTLAICNYGCAIHLHIVVNGLEYGYIWTDDRANYGGIYTSRELGNTGKITFIDWYELWLDNSLEEIKS